VKVDPHALEGIDGKIARAEQHLATLHREMEAWQDREPWTLEPEVHDGGRKHFWRVRLSEPIPVGWAVVLGEAVHDLRSALDQAVYWLTIDWTGKAVDDSAFPVCTSGHNFRHWSKKRKRWNGGCHKIRGIGPGPQAFIEALQPYPQRYRRSYCFEIRLLNDLWNQDKHRLVHLWGLRFGNAQVRLDKRVEPDCIVGIDRRLKHDGAIVLKITCNPPHAEVPMQGEITGMLSLVAGKYAGGASIGLLDMQATVGGVIRSLTAAIGHQRDPIALPESKGRPKPQRLT